jgi:predicted cobalt transporter CbtA
MPAYLFLAPGPQPDMTPTPGALPGSNVIQSLANGLDSWALIAAMVGVVIGAVVWGCTQLTIRKPFATYVQVN